MMKLAGKAPPFDVLFLFLIRCSEFLTGFHKRKLAKAEAAKNRAIDKAKKEHLEFRREVCLVPFFFSCGLTT